MVVVIGMSRNTKSSKPSGEYLTIAEVAIELHLSTKSVRRRISRGEFCPFVRIGRRVLWSRSRLKEWFDSRESPTGIPAQRRTRRAA
jgi:excisionase family DNA binding protein